MREQFSSLWEQATALVRTPITATHVQQQFQQWPPSISLPVPTHQRSSNALPQALVTAQCQPAWNGFLTLKNDKTHVRMFFVSGNPDLARAILPQPAGEDVLPILKISQRMRLEPGQLTMVDLRFEVNFRLFISNVF